MLPAPPNFASGSHLPQFSLQNTFGPGSSYGPHPQPGYLSQALLHDPLNQAADPNSPEVFKDNIQIVQNHVHRLRDAAKQLQTAIQLAYQPGYSPASTEAYISTLKNELAMTIEILRKSGVGALPFIPPSNDDNPCPVPTEQALLENRMTSVRALHEKLQRSQDSAAVVANLLTTDHIVRPAK
ncbi:hypothetical protein JR316_0009518 [Psilocybe cubensis]|uniref:Uncharacterized protein n=2 Tax=Psilocybe cubensis TaxID=181762 RepID=A0ACB8GPC7_PSICU|nr:hypothetical protein JR316_0009518 [Psilocybe cubensis]KAH9477314.1 hypothetical protein JR316_0009518 [Psilocybe cubensis]